MGVGVGMVVVGIVVRDDWEWVRIYVVYMLVNMLAIYWI